MTEQSKKRLHFLDITRVFAFLLIIYYHLLRELELNNSPLWFSDRWFLNENAHVATLGVALFFMISGAGLFYAYRERFELKAFWKSRFRRVLLPFYVSYLIVLAGILFTAGGAYFDGVAPWKAIFTLTATDGYLAVCGITTFTTGVGEWFLGALMIIYVLFPVLRWCMNKNRWITVSIATIAYLAFVYWYPLELPPVYENVFVKLYEFLLGMFLITVLEKIRKKWLIVTLPVILVFATQIMVIPIPEAYRITVFALAVMITVIAGERWLVTKPRFVHGIQICGRYCFAIYLIHHAIITFLDGRFAVMVDTVPKALLLFLAEIMLSVVCGVVIQKAVDLLVSGMNRTQK